MGKAGSGVCVLCGTWRRSLHRDHIIPRFKGGTDKPENIQLICANCHEDKTRVDLTGWPLTLEHREKVSAALKGRLLSPEHRSKLSAAQMGHPQTPETRAKISATRKGQVPTLETREKMSASQRRRATREGRRHE